MLVLTVLEGINQAITTYLISLISKQKLSIKKSPFSHLLILVSSNRWRYGVKKCIGGTDIFRSKLPNFSKKRDIANRPIRPSSKTLYL